MLIPSQPHRITLYWCTIVPMPYMDDLFSALSAHPAIRVVPVFVRLSSPAHPLHRIDAAGHHYLFANIFTYLRILWVALSQPQAKWLIAGWNVKRYLGLVFLLLCLRRSYWIFTDTAVPTGRSSSRVIQWVRSLVLPLIFRHSKSLLTTGKLAVERLATSSLNVARLRNLPYPLDENRFPLGVNRIAGDERPISIVFSGRIHLSDKRFDVALRAFGIALEKQPLPRRLKLFIAGSGPDETVMHDLIRELNIGAHVEVMGWLQQPELAALYRSADIYIHPSDFEPYGVTVVEALYSGLFTVASSQVGAAVELVDEGVNGKLFPAGDVRAAAGALISAIDTVCRPDYSKANVRSASSKWFMANYLQTLDEIFLPNASE